MKLKFFLVSLLSISFSTAAVAGINAGAYAGAHLGKAKTNYDATTLHLAPGTTTSSNNNNSKLGWDLLAGYRFNANLALEVGYTQYDSETFDNVQGVSGASADVKQKAGSLLGVFIFPLTAAANVYAKGGFAYAQEEATINGVGANAGITDTTQNGVRPMFGVGASYEFYPELSLDISYSYLHGSGNIQTASLWGIGLLYTFG